MAKKTFTSYLAEQYNKRTRLAQAQTTKIKDELNGLNPAPLKYPQFSTGARTFIQVAGKPLTLAMEFSYSITAETEEIRTIDTSFPWDIAVGQVKITGTLRKIVHPESSAEEQGLFHTMQSIIHQPYVEIMIQDADGSTQFFARGMFTGIQAAFVRGQVTVQSATFVGVAYQHWAYQEFQAYSKNNKATNAVNEYKKQVSKFLSPVKKFGF
jgi:hypothetical protein